MKNKSIFNVFNDFFNSEKSGGIILIICTIISLFLANSIIGSKYIYFLHQTIDFNFINLNFNISIQHLINDGLMTIFFLLIGLEIERELYIGELSNIKNALLPIIAAIGGMIIPSAIHFIFNNGSLTRSGFGIPMATDIAFSLGVLSLLGKNVPLTLKIFLTAFAIIDDLGAVIVIALFYTKDISFFYLSIALSIFIILLILNKLKIYKILPYIIIGIVLWYCILRSGIHATITGVLLAFAIPFTKNDKNPSYKVQKFLHKPVAFVILPLFAIVNTGILINIGNFSNLISMNSLGIMLGLIIGKPFGIFLFSFLAIILGLCKLPQGLNYKHIFGAGLLGGIGFTMSIFITNLAFTSYEIIINSIVAIMVSSITAGFIGFIYFRFVNFKIKKNEKVT